jgi:transglutaminase-like putative cysteine protease
MSAGALAYLLLRGWPGWMPDLLRACLAVLVLVLALGWWASGRKAERNDLADAKSGRKPGWLDFVSMGLGLLAVECAFLWILSVTPAPLEKLAMGMEQRFRPAAAAKRAELVVSGQVSGNWLWQEEGRRELPKRTNLKPGPKPEVFVRLLDAKDAKEMLKRRVYVSAFVMGRFEDGAWNVEETESKTMRADESGWIRFGEESEREIPHGVFIGKDETGKNVFTALQGARAARLASLQVVSNGIAYLPEAGDAVGYEYLASSAPLRLADLSADVLSVRRPESSTARDRIDRLARRVGGEGSLLEKLRRIESYLKANYGYSLKTENRKNLDPLDNFLFEEKRGHCEFFATAGALMASSLGAETRLAYGWAGGQFFEANNTFVFRAREAHAWVEVRIAGGDTWAVMDPTPVIAFGGMEKPGVAKAGENLPALEEVFEEEAETFDSDEGNLPEVSLILTGAFGSVAILVLLLRTRRRDISSGTGRFPAGENRDHGYLADWRRALKKRGAPPLQGQTLMRQIEEMEEAPDFAAEFLEYHYAVRYEQRAPDPSVERDFKRKIRVWEEAHESAE